MKDIKEFINESLKSKLKRFKEKITDKLTDSYTLPENHLQIRLPYQMTYGGKYYGSNTPTVIKQIKNLFEKHVKIKPYYKGENNLSFMFDLTGVDIKTINTVFDEIVTMYNNNSKVKIKDLSDDDVRYFEMEISNNGVFEYIDVMYRYEK
jgi:hypothetical protein